MTGEEFVRRFLLHIVPSGVHRVRYGGIFHGKGRTVRLDRCRDLLTEYNRENNIRYDYNSVDNSDTTESHLSPIPLVQPTAGRKHHACVHCDEPTRHCHVCLGVDYIRRLERILKEEHSGEGACARRRADMV